MAVALVDSGVEQAVKFATRLIQTISEPYHFGAIEANVSASIGVAGYPASASDANTLLKQADHAMYRAKSDGKKRVCAARHDA